MQTYKSNMLATVLLAGAALGASAGARATVLTDLLFATEADDLRTIGFDGTGFTSGFATVLESGFSPGWTGISYDAGAGLLYFSTEADDLRVIGFDGSGFTSGFATVLESGFFPGWVGISVIAMTPSTVVPAPAVLPLTALGLLLLVAHARSGSRGRVSAA